MFLIRLTSFTQKLGGAVAISLALAAPVHAKDTAKQAAARRALTLIYAKSDQDFVKKDVRALMATLAPDFKVFLQNGTSLERTQYEAVQNMVLANISNIRGRTKIQNIQWRGADAIVFTDSALQWKQRGALIQTTGNTRDYWGLSGGKWLLRQSVILKQQVLVNGKPTTG